MLDPKQSEQIVGFLAHLLQQDLSAVQAVACEGLAKLMLSGMLYDATVRAFCSIHSHLLICCRVAAAKLDPVIPFTRNSRQSTTSPMLELFLPRILLLVRREPREDAQCQCDLLWSPARFR